MVPDSGGRNIGTRIQRKSQAVSGIWNDYTCPKYIVSARTYMHWTAVSGFKAARVAQQGQPSTRCISYFRLSAGCRQFRSWPQENIVLIRHLDKLLHDTYV